ncbi:collagen alpha-1(I) chain-like [Hippopotamus amphibius kiboko]|uniref:collagen alpha-1(I) chain-like n=1 Tax=Hippopotamus amphibius kiboko TaxID=575201 RepID=UPI00259755E5|nr:collagen alpha-1(I) chain-like [Hippopotamus amphibius kiboko]
MDGPHVDVTEPSLPLARRRLPPCSLCRSAAALSGAVERPGRGVGPHPCRPQHHLLPGERPHRGAEGLLGACGEPGSSPARHLAGGARRAAGDLQPLPHPLSRRVTGCAGPTARPSPSGSRLSRVCASPRSHERPFLVLGEARPDHPPAAPPGPTPPPALTCVPGRPGVCAAPGGRLTREAGAPRLPPLGQLLRGHRPGGRACVARRPEAMARVLWTGLGVCPGLPDGSLRKTCQVPAPRTFTCGLIGKPPVPPRTRSERSHGGSQRFSQAPFPGPPVRPRRPLTLAIRGLREPVAPAADRPAVGQATGTSETLSVASWASRGLSWGPRTGCGDEAGPGPDPTLDVSPSRPGQKTGQRGGPRSKQEQAPRVHSAPPNRPRSPHFPCLKSRLLAGQRCPPGRAQLATVRDNALGWGAVRSRLVTREEGNPSPGPSLQRHLRVSAAKPPRGPGSPCRRRPPGPALSAWQTARARLEPRPAAPGPRVRPSAHVPRQTPARPSAPEEGPGSLHGEGCNGPAAGPGADGGAGAQQEWPWGLSGGFWRPFASEAGLCLQRPFLLSPVLTHPGPASCLEGLRAQVAVSPGLATAPGPDVMQDLEGLNMEPGGASQPAPAQPCPGPQPSRRVQLRALGSSPSPPRVCGCGHSLTVRHDSLSSWTDASRSPRSQESGGLVWLRTGALMGRGRALLSAQAHPEGTKSHPKLGPGHKGPACPGRALRASPSQEAQPRPAPVMAGRRGEQGCGAGSCPRTRRELRTVLSQRRTFLSALKPDSRRRERPAPSSSVLSVSLLLISCLPSVAPAKTSVITALQRIRAAGPPLSDRAGTTKPSTTPGPPGPRRHLGGGGTEERGGDGSQPSPQPQGRAPARHRCAPASLPSRLQGGPEERPLRPQPAGRAPGPLPSPLSLGNGRPGPAAAKPSPPPCPPGLCGGSGGAACQRPGRRPETVSRQLGGGRTSTTDSHASA